MSPPATPNPLTPTSQHPTTPRSTRSPSISHSASPLPLSPAIPTISSLEYRSKGDIEEKEPVPLLRASSSPAKPPLSSANSSPLSPRGKRLQPLAPILSAAGRMVPLPLTPLSLPNLPNDSSPTPLTPSPLTPPPRQPLERKEKGRVKARHPSEPIQSVHSVKDVEEVKQREDEPTTPLLDSSDSEEEGDIPGTPSRPAPFSATAPLSSLPVISAPVDFSATQPLSSPPVPPPTFPAPLSYCPPTSSSSLTLSLYVGTWNLYGKPPPPSPTLSLFLPHNRYDLLVIGTEECDVTIEKAVLLSPVQNGRKPQWTRRIWEEIGVDEYVQVEEEGMVAMHVVAFIRKSLYPLLTACEKGRVATGVGNVIGNKGGVAIGLTLGTTSLLFINAHFAAHHHAVDQRNADFHKINAKLPLKGNASTTASPLVCERFDRTFWLGDLNYRIEGTYSLVTHLISARVMEPLIGNDQLTRERVGGRVFAGFYEKEITFRPTYKVDVEGKGGVGGGVRYDTSKKRRVPGWCDRVLWRDVTGGMGLE